MTIREKVARTIDPEAWSFWDKHGMERQRCDETLAITDDAITAFLKAAAEPDEHGRTWHMRRDEATEEMAHAANGFSYVSEYTMRQDKELIDKYRAILEAGPPFEWDK